MMKTCRHCGDEFELRPGKPGYADECPRHSHEGTERHMAEVSWENKHTPVVRVTTAYRARAFNGAQRRFGAGVTRALAPSSRDVPHEVNEYHGPSGGNSAKYATKEYRTRTGEARVVKR